MVSALRDHIRQELQKATGDEDRLRASTLRLVQAAIKERDIASRDSDCCNGTSDRAILEIINKMVHQREDSAAGYEEAGRLDLAERERQEIEVLRELLPPQLSEREIKQAAAKVVDELNATGLKDMGKCMGALKNRYPGRMDFSKANAELKEQLS